ncbi:MAG: hypothetical protein CMJ64_21335 [Planctomycetaceae bacterium]|nr:hypothetical protein [Planctomycetaceae bacterium]
MSVATLPERSDSPLAAEHHTELATANERAKKIRKAAGVANFNGWVSAIFALCSALFALFSLVGFFVFAGLAIVAYNEFQGRNRLLLFDPTAAKFLGRNQLGFLAFIVAYCVWMMFTGLTTESPLAAELDENPEIGQVLGSLEEFDYLYKGLIVAVYGTVIVLSAIFQGLNAVYYFTRRKHIECYLRETPDWVIEVQRTTAAST